MGSEMSDAYPVYKNTISKPPRNGWHCVVDGYDFSRETRETLIETIATYMKKAGIDGDAARMVELAFCHDNPDQCWWGRDG